ncbi:MULTISPECIES: cytochrome c [Caballeronia]|jgi:cytochrome c553|uniref:Cytochrome C554 n=1 Tax=Caballeronia zhejiangensis TaxID=871203 RepID=A0A656QMQ2_9BURK|nr:MULTISPECIES: cytochrome c [Caballeronia]EKS69417.1 cytochrome c [Burkholderia sp. SJ98]KDR29713.1 cytochrome C554 [Caballeronia zhejiangensis]MCG7401746.1 cytochrome c [Caballeronia zhejiangensis]MCI1045316.1 cytochrome c [Caballeronia zhejiangensis]MDR5767007.1 cytochrome c [Caballeronia sp. LZ028]
MRVALTAAVLAGVLAAGASASFAAGDIKAGRAKATACAACHGIDGMSKLPEAPNLAGQTEEYLVKALNDFRTGERKNEMMSMMAKTLSDADVANLAAYYHSLGKQ